MESFTTSSGGKVFMNKTGKLIVVALLITIFSVSAALYYNGKFGSHFFLLQTSYESLPGWTQDNHSKALDAFKQSCTAIMRLDAKKPFSTTVPSSGNASAWQTICQAANKLTKQDNRTAKVFFEYWFQPYRVEDNFNPNGLFTGYYIPLIHANSTKNQNYSTPIYAMPKDLVKLNLGNFRPELLGKTIVGKLKNNLLVPYPSRAAINSGILEKNDTQVLAWSDNPVDVFFAQIQGSAIVELADNSQKILIGYAGDNGHPYTAIGKVLIAKHAIKKKAISMHTIRDWLTEHPAQLQDILNQNASYVFFNILKDGLVRGTQHVPLTPERSLAVDTHYIPLGAPVWLNTTIPLASSTSAVPFQQLLIAQDTGGAIKGIVRADVFWGEGEQAAYTAGYMRSVGQYWILLPRFPTF
jgi:membrane-bound lytic murein transglycosylase A